MPKAEYNGFTFDSPDELELYFWLEEALEHDLICGFTYQGPTWQLAEPVIETIEQFGAKGQKIKPKQRVVLKGVTYTTDFHIIGAKDFVPINEYIDVKPKFSRRDSDAAKFSILRKWLYQRHQVLVCSLVPWDLFNVTFAPAEARVTPKKREPRKHYCDLPTVEEFAKAVRLREKKEEK